MVRIVTLALLTLTLSFLATAAVWAQDKDKEKDKKVQADPRLNKSAPTFELPGTDGKNHKLTDYKGKTVIIHFQSNQCPWERAYQPILSKLASDNPNVVFLGINSNKAETMEEIKATQDKEKIPYVILKDKGNKVADDYGAQTTPHIYIIDATGKLVYVGGVEKAPANASSVGKAKEQYLTENLAAIKDGKALPYTQTLSKGCGIKRE